jgi:L-fucose isomerase-like protein
MSLGSRTTFGVIVGTRGFFNPRLAIEGRRNLLRVLEELGYDYVILDEKATPNGAVETLSDARKTASLFRAQGSRIDGILVSLPNFGDETGVAQALGLARLEVPVLLHAFDDDPDKVSVEYRRDAFCGKISVANNLRQYRIPWTDTAEHTCPVDGPELARDLAFFAGVCRVVRGVRGARIAAIGARPAAFQTVRYSEKMLQSAGITVVTVDLSEIIAAAERIRGNTREMQEKLDAIRSYGRIPERIPAALVMRQAKLSVAIDRWMAKHECAASAVQCWDSIQKNYGCAACLSMSLMGEGGLPSACEVDVTGAVSMYVLGLASGNAPGFLDWNNNYGTDREKCVNTHCSNFPKSFIGGEVEISELDVLGTTLGRENCFGAVKGKVSAGPMSFFRMHTDETEGLIRSYAGEGEFTDDPFAMDGGIAVCRVPRLRALLSHVTQYGFEHHVAMVRGLWAKAVHEATSRYLGWNSYLHSGSEPREARG